MAPCSAARFALLLLAGLVWQPNIADAWYVRLTRPFNVNGIEAPAGSYVPVAREAPDAWYVKPTTSSFQIPKSVAELVPRTMFSGRYRVGIDTTCKTYFVDPPEPQPQAALLVEQNAYRPNHVFTSANLLAREGDSYIVRWNNDPRGEWAMDDQWSRLPLSCISFRPGTSFQGGMISRPFEAIAANLTYDTPVLHSSIMVWLGGGLLALILARLIIFR